MAQISQKPANRTEVTAARRSAVIALSHMNRTAHVLLENCEILHKTMQALILLAEMAREDVVGFGEPCHIRREALYNDRALEGTHSEWIPYQQDMTV